MQQTRLFLCVLAFQLFLLLLISLPSWRASGSRRVPRLAGSGVLLLLTGLVLLAAQGSVPSFVGRVVAPCAVLEGVRRVYEAARDLCDIPPAPGWELGVVLLAWAVMIALWAVDHSPDQTWLARGRFVTVSLAVCVINGGWLSRLWRQVARPWSLGTRYLAWAATLALVTNLGRCIAVAFMHGAHDPLGTPVAPMAVLGVLPTSLLFAFGLILQVEARVRNRLLVANSQLAHDAETDLLTGLGNRRRLETAGLQEVARARRYGWPVAVMVLDLDHFKAINDRWGHHAGDAVLREVAIRCQRVLRSHEVLVRWGGEEFAVLLPQCDLAMSEIVARRILESIREISIAATGGEHFTASIGVAQVETSEGSINGALQRADAALYQAKRAGRDRHAIAGARPVRESSPRRAASAQSIPPA